MKDCTCRGSCRGAEGLGPGWNCVVENGPREGERYQPVPVPRGDGRHDIGDDVRAAIVERLMSDWNRDPDLTPEKVQQLAMWAGASVRALLHELGSLRDLASEADLMPEAEALMLDGPARGAPAAVDERSTERATAESTGAFTERLGRAVMNRLLELQQKIQDTHALIKQTERTVSGVTTSPSALANLRSLEKRRESLERDFLTVAEDAGLGA